MINQKYEKIGIYRQKIEKYEESIEELEKALDKSDSIDNGVIELSDNIIRLSEELIEGMGAGEFLLDSLTLDSKVREINYSLNSTIENTIKSLKYSRSEAFLSIDKLYQEIDYISNK